ncbi:thermonuclease family protein [Fulvimarina sp. MAC3]|uniref:thermonuclease family protein n=1 Tax=Fulvimarina sp. MAC3 TaxID=3148887 RepID=UPI0031FBB9EC
MRRFYSFLATALGLVIVVAGLFALVPADIADQKNAGDIETGDPGSGAGEANEESRDEAQPPVQSRTIEGRRPEGKPLQPLRRVAPREPLSKLAAPKSEPESIQQRLLPRPIAIDAGHIRIDRAMIVLPGIDAPAADARCGQGAGEWPCGTRARTALRAYLRGRSVECMAPRDFGEREETVTSSCTLAGEDIAGWIVSNGWAKAVPDGPYTDLESSARKAGRGIWK